MQHSQLSNTLTAADPPGEAASRHRSPVRNFVTGYIGLMDRISAVTAVFAALLLLSGVLSVCHMIVVRSILGGHTIWQTEYTIYSITGAMLLGSPYVLRCGGHVAVTVLFEVVSKRVQRILQFFASLTGLLFCAALAFASWRHLIEAYSLGWGTGTVWNPPLWAAILPITIGSTLLVTQYVAEMLRKED